MKCCKSVLRHLVWLCDFLRAANDLSLAIDGTYLPLYQPRLISSQMLDLERFNALAI